MSHLTSRHLGLGFVCAALAVPALAQEGFIECARVLWTASLPDGGRGATLASVPDVNGDGVPELLFGTPRSPTSGVRLLDGANGRELFRIDGTSTDLLGYAVGSAGDVDGDGVGDLLASALGVGAVRVYSGVDGTQLSEVTGVPGSFGVSVASVGDLDGDGVPDLAVSEGGAVKVHVLSGADGHALHTLTGPGAFGVEIVPLFDTQRGGKELVVLAAGWFPLIGGLGRVSAFDLVTGAEVFSVVAGFGEEFMHVAVLNNVAGNSRFITPGIAIAGKDTFSRAKMVIYNRWTRTISKEFNGEFSSFFGSVAGLGPPEYGRASSVALVALGHFSPPDPFSAPGTTLVGPTVTVHTALFGNRVLELTLPQNDRLLEQRRVQAIGHVDLDGDGLDELVVTTDAGNETRVYVVSSLRPVTVLGRGVEGSGHIQPQISFGGCPRIRGTARIDTERVRGGAFGVLVLGGALAQQPFHGGTLYPRRDLRIVHRASGARGVPGAGDASLRLDLPDDPALVGTKFFAQAAYLDSGAQGGVALTSALQVVLY